MKKILLLLGLLIAFSSVSYGSECSYTCVEKYNMNNKFSSFISSITGLNFARTKITESIMKKTINKSVKGGKLDVDIDSYSAKDLANGIFKSLKISGKNISVDDIYLTFLELKSLCEFNYIEYDRKGNLVFKEDFPMSFEIQMSNDDLNKSMQSEHYKKVINDVNKLGFGGIKVSSTQASIRGNKFYYSFVISIPFMKDKKIEISADLKVKNGAIDFENTRLSSNSFNFDLKKVGFLMKYLNPLDFSVNIFNNKDAKAYIRNIAIKNNIIITDGIIIIPKD